ncbi:MAG: hypothetical protein U1A78_38870 [Polyangia bacterium]
MKTIAWALALSLIPVAAHAQRRPEIRQDKREVRQDQREVRQDQRQLADDRRDARRYANLLAAFDQARASAQPQAMAAIDQRVQTAINAEINESNREVAQKGAEANRSQAEVGRGRREVGRDMVRGQPVRAADDRRDLRDDRRDAADDRRDARREVMDNNRLRTLAAEYAGLVGRFDPPSMERKRTVLVTLNQMAAAEVAGDRRETREDRREMREDKRELREDRRQGP